MDPSGRPRGRSGRRARALRVPDHPGGARSPAGAPARAGNGGRGADPALRGSRDLRHGPREEVPFPYIIVLTLREGGAPVFDAYIRVSQLGDRTPEEATEVYEAQVREWADRN